MITFLTYDKHMINFDEVDSFNFSTSESHLLFKFIKYQTIKITCYINLVFLTCTQIKMLFLQWLPCLLRMSRPGKKITKKTILGGNRRAKGMELQEKSSKSLLANVLDIDDDIRHKNSAANPPSGYIRYISLNFLYLLILL